jgi:hypothetical protein
VKKIIFILSFLISCVINSQVSSVYTFSETTGTYTPITGGVQLVTTTGGVTSYDTDGSSVTLSSGSQFVFNGSTITSVNMTADGSLWLNPTTTTTGNGVTGPISSNSGAAGVISALGMDLRSTAISSQLYERRWEDLGSEVVFQWQNCARYLQSSTERFSFQIRIEKSTGNIRVVYGNMTTIANSTTYQPQVGLRGTTNADYNTRRLTNSVPDASPNWGAPNGTTAGTSNAHTCRFTSNGTCYPTSGLIFIWTYTGAPNNNDFCSNATTITTPYSSGLVSTIGSTSDVPTSTSSCATQSNNVWYKITGTDKNLIASTCNNSTNFDTEIRVYTGTCGSLNTMVEVDCNDDEATCAYSTVQSVVTWCATSGVDYYISVGYFSSTGGTGNFILSVTENGVCGAALPIELLDFSGKFIENYNLLNWVTTLEINNDFFTIERSINGSDWEFTDNIDGSGNSSIKKEYNYKDYKFVDKQINYYRLKQTDYNGNFKYFNVISIDNTNLKKRQLIKMTDILGRPVSSEYVGIIFLIYDDGSYEKIIKFMN